MCEYSVFVVFNRCHVQWASRCSKKKATKTVAVSCRYVWLL